MTDTGTGTALRPYQAAAVEAIAAELAAGGRAQAQMACGTGKTLVAATVAARLAAGGVTVVLVPSISLVAQTIRAWDAGCPVDRVLAVCSDRTAGHGGTSGAGLTVPVSTDPEFIAKWVADTAGRALIAGTYDSAARVAGGLRRAGQEAELVVCDEAHHLAGAAGKVTAAALQPGFLPARRFLFVTATPRIATGVQAGGELAVASMDDHALFGRPVFTYPAGQAISDGWLKDYRLVVAAMSNASVAALLEESGSLPGEGGVLLRMAAAQAALGMAVAELGLRRCVAFVPTVAAARLFARTLPATLAMLPADRRPAGPVSAGFVHGKMTALQREIVLDRLRQPPEGGWSVVANARCLGEGVDIPEVDSVLFAAPKDSVTDIVQAAGRPLRLSGQASTAAIIVPAVLPDGADDQGGQAGRWENVVRVVRALAAHDDRLSASLTAVRASSRDGSRTEPELPASIAVHAPPGTAARILDALRVRIINATTSSWWQWHALIREYHRAHGHADVPANYRAPGGQLLGKWLAGVKNDHARGALAADRAAALEELCVTWSLREAAWQRGLAHTGAYRAAHGHLSVPGNWTTEDGFPLGQWLVGNRVLLRAGTLDPARTAELKALGVTAETRAQAAFQHGLDALDTFIATFGHARVPARYAAPGGFRLGRWVNYQRTCQDQTPAASKAALDERGMIWDAHAAAFADGLEHLDAYIAENHSAQVPQSYIAADGYRLGFWISRIRRRRSNPGPKDPALTADQSAALDKRGIT